MTEPNESRPSWPLAAGRKWLLLALDAPLVGLSLYVAYYLRFDGRIPPYYLAQFWSFLPLLVVIRVAVHAVVGIHHWSFRLAGLSEALRIALAGVAGTACFVAVPYGLGIVMPPRSVVVTEFFLTTSLLGAFRFSRRLAQPWSREQRRLRSNGGAVRALIVGAGDAGDLLLRDLQRRPDHSYEIVGFVDDDPAMRRVSVGGRVVLGTLDEVPGIARRKGIQELLIAIPKLPAARLRQLVANCSDLKLKYKVLPLSYAYLNERRGSGLEDLAPEDLLPREQAGFDRAELRSLVEGRRVLVTGAAGSIGSEICRQVAAYEPSQLALADINENDLYLLCLELQRAYPKLAVQPEIVDIRDGSRVLQLGRASRPQQVFHAAAHKHVPLMEHSPEEAVKNNVSGCRNLIEMAEQVGVSRFVLISTDKAVRPASVMGATKKLAEMLVRDRARRAPTVFTTVRFGNVLGSAGSVVPIFKRQIAAGGPVTVTHPDCRRYLMTIPEAVGLVLLAGLQGYGDLCLLDMGEPIRILDLARYMITLAGLVPDQDIPIAFTGLRPGEKIEEELATEQELRDSHLVAPNIRVISSLPPPPDLVREVERLEAAALAGDREGVLAALRSAVPDYTPASSPHAVLTSAAGGRSH